MVPVRDRSFRCPLEARPWRSCERVSLQWGGVTIVSIETAQDIASNGAGDLAFIAGTRRISDGTNFVTVIRKRGRSLEQVAQEGDTVEPSRGAGVKGHLLGEMFYPRISAQGTVIFSGTTEMADGTFVKNVFAQGQGQSLHPIPAGYFTGILDLAVDERDSVAVLGGRSLYLVAPTGEVSLVVDGDNGLEPWYGLTFDAHGDLFFRARNSALPRDRYGNFPFRLFRYRRGAVPSSGTVGEVEVTPSSSGKSRLLSVTQAPVLSLAGAAVGALVGDSERFATPTGALFQVNLEGSATESGSLIAKEADALSGADRVGIPKDLYYTNEGSLVADVILPGGGSAAITVRSAATTASGARFQSGLASALIPLVATGQSLGQPDRTLLGFLGAFVPFGTDGQLVLARYSQGNEIGEGLFNVSRSRGVDLLADTFQRSSNTRLTSFSESWGTAWDVPSVSPEGNIVFQAGEDRGGAVPQSGVFQWMRNTGAVVRMFSDPEISPLRWEASSGGAAYIFTMTNVSGQHTELIKCSFLPDTQITQIERLVVGGSTIISGRGQEDKLPDLGGFAIDGSGEVFITSDSGLGLFHLNPSTRTLEPVLLPGDPLPPFTDGRKTAGLQFGFVTRLLRDSRRGSLLFRAVVSGGGPAREGLFRRTIQGQLETVLLQAETVTGSREITVSTLGDTEERQSANGMSAFAVKDDKGWTILWTRQVRDAQGRPVLDSKGNPQFETTVIVRDGQRLEPGHLPVKLNARACPADHALSQMIMAAKCTKAKEFAARFS
jgi:hypothetical protein